LYNKQKTGILPAIPQGMPVFFFIADITKYLPRGGAGKAMTFYRHRYHCFC